ICTQPRPPPSLLPYTTLFRSYPQQNQGASCPLLQKRWSTARPPDPSSTSPSSTSTSPASAGTSGASPSRASPTARSTRSWPSARSEEHTSELQSRENLVCRLL